MSNLSPKAVSPTIALPPPARIERVCSACFGDPDVRAWIRDAEGPRGCDACGGYDSPTVELSELCDYLGECLSKFWGSAAEQLPYESAEGGYIGETWMTAELVFDEVGLDLPRDAKEGLRAAMFRGLDDQLWCDYDWLRLDGDVAMRSSWERFCDTIKRERRFFFQHRGGFKDDPDCLSHLQLLKAISRLCDELGLVRYLDPGTELFRARTDLKRGAPLEASTFGPPRAEKALQSNRMNPPGIPMFYGAEAPTTAVRETRKHSAKVGKFRATQKLRVLDLVHLPEIPSIWSNPDRDRRLGLRFLHDFTDAIMQPVARDDRSHIDYIPSQVVTEYFRDFSFASGRLHGIRYPSTVDRKGRNVVLFIESVMASPASLGAKPTPPLVEYLGWKRVRG